MWIALAVVSVLAIGGWSLAGYLIHKYKPWSAMGRFLNKQIDKWHGPHGDGSGV